MKRLALVTVLACAFLAPAAHAAPAPTRWCGSGETAADRLPDATASYQLHVVYAVPSDGADRFAESILPILRDLAAIDSWWRAQDSTRALRWDTFAFPGCDTAFGALDVSFLRLPRAASAYYEIDQGGYENLVRDFAAAYPDTYKKFAVYYDGPQDPDAGICGVSSLGPDSSGASYAFTLVQGDPNGFCGSLGNSDYMAATMVHELMHNLGAVVSSAPHECEDGHVCDNPLDLMSAAGPSNSLFDYALDVGRDDYYGHSGSWWDVQDSPFLAHLNAPQYTLTVTQGAGSVRSDLPGIACPPACSIAWDSGTKVVLSATPPPGQQFLGWSGACTGQTCELTMDAARSVTATFGLPPARLTVVVTGKGRVTSSPAGISCPVKCSATFPGGTAVRLTATPARGYRFRAWSGACRGTVPRCTAQSGTATAVFAKRV